MPASNRSRQFRLAAVWAAAALLVAALAASAVAKPRGQHQGHQHQAKSKPAPGALTQLAGKRGCLVDRRRQQASCATVRALNGPGPFMGSRAIALSPDGRNVYVASSNSDAIAIFVPQPRRRARSTQAKGRRGCVAAQGAQALRDGDRASTGRTRSPSAPTAATSTSPSRASSAVHGFRRNPASGALRQLPPGGCLHRRPAAARLHAGARAVSDPDVVVVSPDGENVYVGSFFGNAVAAFARDPSSGALTQLAGAAGCIAEAKPSGCAAGIALRRGRGPGDQRRRRQRLRRRGALQRGRRAHPRPRQRRPQPGRATAAAASSRARSPAARPASQLAGANAVAVSPDDDDVYVDLAAQQQRHLASAAPAGGVLSQKQGTAGCLVYLRAAGCSLRPRVGRAGGPGRLAATAATSTPPPSRPAPIDVLNRGRQAGALRPEAAAARAASARVVPAAPRGRALQGRQLDRAQPRRPQPLLDRLRAATRSTSSGGTDERSRAARRTA